MVFHGAVALYMSADATEPEMLVSFEEWITESASAAKKDKKKTLPPPLDRSTGNKTTLLLSSPLFTTVAKGKALEFYCGDKKTDTRQREKVNSICYRAIRNRLLRYRYSITCAQVADPRMISYLDYHPTLNRSTNHNSSFSSSSSSNSTPGCLILDCQKIRHPTYKMLLLLLSSSPPGRPITQLSLRQTGLTVEQFRAIVEALERPHMMGLSRLDLADNPQLNILAPDPAVEENKKKKSTKTKKKVVKVHPLIQQLLETVKFCFELKYLGLAGLNLGNEGLVALAPVLTSMMDAKLEPIKDKFPCNLRWLDLSENNISDNGFIAFIQSWRQVSKLTLTGLSLNNNNISDIGATVLSNLVRSALVNFKLVHLRLQHNQIGDKGCEALALGLLKHKSLLELEISFNPISDAGMEQFMSLVETEGNSEAAESSNSSSKPAPAAVTQQKQSNKPSLPPPIPNHNNGASSSSKPPPLKTKAGPPLLPKSGSHKATKTQTKAGPPPVPPVAKRVNSRKASAGSKQDTGPLEAFTVADLLRPNSKN